MMLEIAPSRRFTIAKALEGVEQTPDLRLALAEWRRQEDHPTVRAVLDKWLDPDRLLAEAVRRRLNDGDGA